MSFPILTSIVALPVVASDPAVLRGLIAVRYAAATQWSDPVVPSGGSADFDHRPLSTVVWSFTFSSDSRIRGNFAGSGPSASGTHQPGAIPCGKKIPAKRLFGAAAVCARAVAAGTIASSSGRATVIPAPRRNVRRGIRLLVMNDMVSWPPSSLYLQQDSRCPALYR